ncbi:MAG: permease [Armatimonadia bacterium]
MHQELPGTSEETCCRPRRPLLLVGLVTVAILGIAYVLQWRQIGAALQGLPRPQDTLLGVVDVFKCCVLSWKALTTMLPAFLLGGAIAAFAPTALVLRYLGARSNQPRAYATAAFSGVLLSLCSCNIVPLFMGIYRRGAGVGPAFTFLFAGPAINVVAMIFTFQVIGPTLGIWRSVGVPILAVIIGLFMAAIYGRENRDQEALPTTGDAAHDTGVSWRLGALFSLLLAMVLFGAYQTDVVSKQFEQGSRAGLPLLVGGMLALGIAIIVLMKKAFDLEERKLWWAESWALIKLVIPVLLPAILIIGVIATYIDVKPVYQFVGPTPEGSGFWTTLRPILNATLFGEVMYFPILTEVAFTKAFLKLGMDIGPALALLISGPGTSLPGFIVLGRAIGWRKALVYELMVVIVTAAFALFFATGAGQYVCQCMLGK